MRSMRAALRKRGEGVLDTRERDACLAHQVLHGEFAGIGVPKRLKNRRGAAWWRRRDHWNSMERSRAGAEWVRRPMEMQSMPVRATPVMVSRVMPPEAFEKALFSIFDFGFSVKTSLRNTNSFSHLVGSKIIEEYDVGPAARERFPELVKGVHFQPESDARIKLWADGGGKLGER